MAAFSYTAVDNKGREQKGVLEADSPKQIRQQLRLRGLNPLNVTLVQEREMKTGGQRRIGRRQTMTVTELALFTRQLATLLAASMPLEEALKAVAEQTEKDKARGIVMAVRAKVLEGFTLARGLAEFPKAFSELYRATIAAGEQSGHLDVVLQRLADYTERQYQTRRKIQHALIYPSIMTLVSIGIVAFLLAYVVPKMVNVFQTTGQSLPFVTQILLAISASLKHYGLYVLAVLVIGILIFRQGLKNPIFRAQFHRFLLKLPVFGKGIRTVNTARFSRTFGILTQASVPVVEAMRVSSELILNIPMREAVIEASARVKEGANIHLALKQTHYFPPMSIHLIASGESSGQLEAMLERSANSQEEEMIRLIDTILALFEPMLILVMGAIVLFIVMAVLLPIFSLDQFSG